jgi:hypothetical protein
VIELTNRHPFCLVSLSGSSPSPARALIIKQIAADASIRPDS